MTWGGRKIRELMPLVIATYGNQCWLCGLLIDLELKYPHELSLSVDHRVPRSLGGSNELDNLAPAHLSCNTRRGARSPTRSVRSGFVDPRF